MFFFFFVYNTGYYVIWNKYHLCSQDKQLRDVGDWRKNIEDKSDRKKMFDS